MLMSYFSTHRTDESKESKYHRVMNFICAKGAGNAIILVSYLNFSTQIHVLWHYCGTNEQFSVVEAGQ